MNDSSSASSSSIISLPILQDETSNFLEWFRSALAQGNAPLVHQSDRAEWVGAISNFCRYLLSTLPFPRGWKWNLLHEKTKLIELCLEFVRRAMRSTDSLFVGYDNHAKTLFATLMGLCHVLDQWCLLAVPSEEEFLSPQELRTCAMKAAAELLHCLGQGVKSGNDKDKLTSSVVLGLIVDSCLNTCKNHLETVTLLNFPLNVSLFGTQEDDAEAGVFDSSGNTKGYMVIQTMSQLPGFLSLLVSTALNGLRSPTPCQNYLVDHTRRAMDIARSLADFFLSDVCVTSLPQRAVSVSRVLEASIPFLSQANDIVNRIRSRLLLFRLKSPVNQGWESLDLALYEACDMGLESTPSKPEIMTILDLLLRHQLNETIQNATLSYLCQYIPHLDQKTVGLVSNLLLRQQNQEEGKIAALTEVVQNSIQVDNDHKSTRNKYQLFNEIRVAVETIVSPDSLSWMDDDTLLSRSQYVSRALTDITTRFNRPLSDPSPQGRIALGKKLLVLSCTISHHDTDSCSSVPSNKYAAQIIVAYVPIILKILDGPDNEVTIAVRQNVLDMLYRCMKHHSTVLGGEVLKTVDEICCSNLRHKARNVRLSAGRLATELIRIYQIIDGNESKHALSLFNNVSRLLKQNDVYRESALVILGYIAQVAVNDMLGRAICTIFSQLGKENPAIKGTAYMQLLALAKYYNKSYYDLLAPYMSQIAYFAVSRKISQPGLLVKLCRFISMDSPELLRHTLHDTLPELFVTRNDRVLEAIGLELGEKVSRLLMDHSSEIFARVFLLQTRPETDQALVFIMKVLVNDTEGNGDIEVKTLVGACSIPLLAELVIVMGEEGGGRNANAIEAIKRVQHILAPSKKMRPSSQGKIAKEYLASNMLAVVTRLSEILHEMHGKKSISSKRQIIRSLGPLISYVGKAIAGIGLQIMATLQTTLGIPPLVSVTLETWSVFLTTLGALDIGPFVGATSAAFLASWKTFNSREREIVKGCLEYIVIECGDKLGRYLDEIAEDKNIPELSAVSIKLNELRKDWEPEDKLRRILDRSSSENLAIACQALEELTAFMISKQGAFIRSLAHGDVFSSLVGEIVSKLFAAASRDDDNAEPLRLLAYTCIGIFGAVDPDRFELDNSDSTMIMLSNFSDEGESVAFALHLIQDVLVGVFRSASDINYQTHIAFVIQELLKFCKFTPALVSAALPSSISLKIRNRWNSLPRHIMETVAPFLESKYHVLDRQEFKDVGLVYPNHATYRDWIQHWAAALLDRVSGTYVDAIFPMFHWVVVHKDAGIAQRLLPHLVLNILISGNEEDVELIRSEILAVLQDQVNPDGRSGPDKRLLSTQAIFALMDHLNKWVRLIRQDIANKKSENRRFRPSAISDNIPEQLLRVDSILSSIDQNLVAKAALQCKAFARSLMNFERQIIELRNRNDAQTDLQSYYEHLHEIYAHLDEPDGMEGVSTLIISPSLEHQIRQHESTGRWTSAQSCWEVRLQHDPDNLEYHVGLLRCLRNLGHYDTLRTHVKGVLTRNPGWEATLAGFQVESAWMIGDWDDVTSYVGTTKVQSSAVVMARALLALRNGDASGLASSLTAARKLLGSPITAAGSQGYRRCYEAVLDLHILHELEVIDAIAKRPEGDPFLFYELVDTLSARLDATLPAFRVREPILSMRRTAFGLRTNRSQDFQDMIGRTWLASAKTARKAGHWQTAYSAMLQAQQKSTPFWFIESAKLIKGNGEPLRALHELENALGRTVDVGATDDSETRKMKGKALVLRARWMSESERFQSSEVMKAFQSGADALPNWESGHFHLGNFQDESYKSLSSAEKQTRGLRMKIHTVRYFSRAIKAGSKYVYQTVPRLLTLWLDMGEDQQISGDVLDRMNGEISRAIESIPTYKWFTAFPQIASRVGHNSKDVFTLLSSLICRVIGDYPKQALWLFTSVVKSTKQIREQRGKKILDQLKTNPQYRATEVPAIINECLAMTNELLALCDYPVKDDKKALIMSKDFPRLSKLAPSKLIIPLQESLTVNFPPATSSDAAHDQSFPLDAPTFQEFFDDVEVMKSLARPRKITIRGSDGQIYMFLGKPKDDLRKDARLMDFNAIINKLLKANMESRRRQLYIRTYGVVTLNEECGFIQWVQHTIPVRPVLIKAYEARSIKTWSTDMQRAFAKIKETADDKEVVKVFVDEVLKTYPPIFHEWFLETFPEPSIWLSSRLAYSRTCAVMSMIGFILGLGDRHCENILLDFNTGDVVHVDFNCLFEKGKTLETPERVPFRLTQNIVDGLGVTGVEGVFRLACEITMRLLHDNKDCLMSVLDAFIHDPLMEWEDEKRRRDRDARKRNNTTSAPNRVQPSIDLRSLAKNALNPIDKKLRCIYTASKERTEKEISTSNLVQILIQEATDDYNLAKMYPGWAPYL